MKEVIEEVKVLNYIHNINTTLELGPYKSPLVEQGDIIDITDSYLKDYPIEIGKFYKHDCSLTPYPIKDKMYDLVIACQVLEHLGRNQIEVFKELSRIGRMAIITLPYKWNLPCDIHHMIDENVINNWANGLKPIFQKIVNGRILLVYSFDGITNLEYNKKIQDHADFAVLNRLEEAERKCELIERELSNKNRIVNDLLNSHSWKLTKPFRKIRRIFETKD